MAVMNDVSFGSTAMFIFVGFVGLSQWLFNANESLSGINVNASSLNYYKLVIRGPGKKARQQIPLKCFHLHRHGWQDTVHDPLHTAVFI